MFGLLPGFAITQWNSYIQVPVSGLDCTQPISVEALFRSDNVGSDARFCDIVGSDCFYSHKYTGGGWTFGFTNGSINSETNPGYGQMFRTDQWYHLVATCDGYAGGGHITFYKNGIQMAGGAALGNAYATRAISHVTIGADPYGHGNSSNNFFGEFAVVRIYQRALSLSDVRYNLANLADAQRNNLFLEFIFSQQPAPSYEFFDTSGNGWIGTLKNGANFGPTLQNPAWAGLPF